MLVTSVLLLLPTAVALLYREKNFWSFLVTAAVFLAVGLLFMVRKPAKGAYRASEGFVITALSWILISLGGALPFVISREIPSFIDAFFETVSGFTTTGSTILTNVEAMSKGMLFWRSFTHWVGGMGVLAFGIALFPLTKNKKGRDGGGSEAHIMRAEAPGPTYGKLVSKVRFSARILYGIYFGMTVLEAVMLICGGMPVFDSIVNSFATAGTGGFGILNGSIASYNSVYAEMVIAVFMMLFGINFNVFYFILIGKFRAAFKNEEVKWYLGIIAASVVAIAVNITSVYNSVSEAFRYSFFQVSSVMTTTGFSTANFDLWPTFSKVILVLLMFIGACAGSTGGGLKISRVIILIKTALREVRYAINPRGVHAIRCDGETIPHEVVVNTSSYFAVYMIFQALSTLLISIDGLDFTTTVTAVVACFNNIGPGLSLVGPEGNFSMFSDFSKIILSFDMLLGRLEIFPLIIIFAPSAWKNK